MKTKNILFLFICSLLLLGCSDDECCANPNMYTLYLEMTDYQGQIVSGYIKEWELERDLELIGFDDPTFTPKVLYKNIVSQDESLISIELLSFDIAVTETVFKIKNKSIFGDEDSHFLKVFWKKESSIWFTAEKVILDNKELYKKKIDKRTYYFSMKQQVY
ncbi:MAG: hypothetical protein Q4G08_01130 [Capnocytophaga sp.]|nr:hypothetical protein [Capnocytophaga sp.]